MPFCSHGGGRFGQSLTAVAKLAPEAVMGEGLAVDDSDVPEDVVALMDEMQYPQYSETRLSKTPRASQSSTLKQAIAERGVKAGR